MNTEQALGSIDTFILQCNYSNNVPIAMTYHNLRTMCLSGVRRVRPSYSGEHLGGLVESSSAESFVSNKSEDPGDHPRGGSLSGLVIL